MVRTTTICNLLLSTIRYDMRKYAIYLVASRTIVNIFG
jgi:hypothetical protein